MKYLFTSLFLITNLLAHGAEQSHVHFFSSLHVNDFMLLLVGLFALFSAYVYLKREHN